MLQDARVNGSAMATMGADHLRSGSGTAQAVTANSTNPPAALEDYQAQEWESRGLSYPFGKTRSPAPALTGWDQGSDPRHGSSAGILGRSLCLYLVAPDEDLSKEFILGFLQLGKVVPA